MPGLRRNWVFMDETGLLVNDPTQPYFALGTLKLEQTATLFAELNRLNQRARSKVNPRFEFKFNRINSNNRRLYMDLVDLFFRFPGLYFKAFVVDTQHPGFDLEGYFRGPWEAQIRYAGLLLENIIGPDEQVAVLADYLDKPKAATTFLEDALLQVARSYKGGASVPPVFNVCMLESDASLFIQLVDVLLAAGRLRLQDPPRSPRRQRGEDLRAQRIERPPEKARLLPHPGRKRASLLWNLALRAVRSAARKRRQTMKTRAVSLANARTKIIPSRTRKATSSATSVSGTVTEQVRDLTTAIGRSLNAENKWRKSRGRSSSRRSTANRVRASICLTTSFSRLTATAICRTRSPRTSW